MFNVGKWFIGQVARFDNSMSGNFRRNVGLDLPHEFYHLVEDLTGNTPKEERGPLTSKIINQLQYLSKQPEWPSFGIDTKIIEGDYYVGPTMKDGAGNKVFWGTAPRSETLKTLTEGLDRLGWERIEELTTLLRGKGWTPPKGFWELPEYKQMPILEKALKNANKLSEPG